MTQEELLRKIAGKAKYRGGFVSGNQVLPFLDCTTQAGDAGWSDEIADELEEHSLHHFIDVYNRRIALEAVTPALSAAGNTFLDAGCSSGYLLADVKHAFPECVLMGADFFSAGLRHCHKNHPDIPLLRLDLTDCPLPPDLFDAVACLNVLEHIQDDNAAIRQLHRILKPGGTLAVTVPAGPKLFDLYDEIHYHQRRYDLTGMVSQIKAAGFEILKANYFGVMLYPAFWFVKKNNQRKYRALDFKSKQDIAMQQIRATSRSRFFDFLCRVEESVGGLVPFPAGIRLYVTARKPMRGD